MLPADGIEHAPPTQRMRVRAWSLLVRPPREMPMACAKAPFLRQPAERSGLDVGLRIDGDRSTPAVAGQGLEHAEPELPARPSD